MSQTICKYLDKEVELLFVSTFLLNFASLEQNLRPLRFNRYRLCYRDQATVMTVSTILLVLTCCATLSGAFQTSRLSRISSTFASKSGLNRKVLFADSQVIDQEQEVVFNSDAVISKERWDFADDIYLITTTEKGSQRLERTKEQLEKVNMMNKVKIRTFKPDDEDRVRGTSPFREKLKIFRYQCYKCNVMFM